MPKKEIVTYTHCCDIPESVILKYKEAFDMFDKNQTGIISATDLTKIMKNFGYHISRNQVEEKIIEINPNGEGELDFEEFVTLMEEYERKKDRNDNDIILNAFISFDKDNDGKINNDEFKYILSKLGHSFTEEECNTFFKECNLDKDGLLNYKDFINFENSLNK